MVLLSTCISYTRALSGAPATLFCAHSNKGDSEHNNNSKDLEDEESPGDSSLPNGQSTSLSDATAEDRQSDSSSAKQQPLPKKEVSNLSYLIWP